MSSSFSSPRWPRDSSLIIEKKLGNKDRKMVYGVEPGKPTLTIPIERAQRNRFCITDEQALDIAKSVASIEKYYSEKKGHWCPMDVEWAVDGLNNQLFIVQARPETIHSRKATDRVVEYKLINPDEATPNEAKKHPVITTGIAIGDRAGAARSASSSAWMAVEVAVMARISNRAMCS